MKTTIVGDRRPIAARHWQLSHSLARFLIILRVSPNAISLFGLAFGIASGIALVATSIAPRIAPIFWLLGAALVLLRLAANMLDGMVAIESNTKSQLGGLFNEVPDRISDAVILIGLGHAAGGNIALGYLAAIAAIFTAYVRAVGKVAGASQQFCGPMAKQHRMAVVIAVAIFSSLIQTDWMAPVGLAAIVVGSVVTASRRLERIAVQLRRGER